MENDNDNEDIIETTTDCISSLDNVAGVLPCKLSEEPNVECTLELRAPASEPSSQHLTQLHADFISVNVNIFTPVF